MHLKKSLTATQICFMGLGSAIGTGLFLGSSVAINLTGPSILLTYAIGGIATFIVLRAIGEMALHDPTGGSFAHYAKQYINPLMGYLTGWGYFLFSLVVASAEVTGVAIYMKLWFPDVAQWIWALSGLILMPLTNLIAVKWYGWFETIFSLIKVVTISLFIIAGIILLNSGMPTEFPMTVSNLWSHGFFTEGWNGFLLALPLALFSFTGIEVIGLAAAEAQDAKRTIPKAINSLSWRIIVFYIGTLIVMLSIFPWFQLAKVGSPFVHIFQSFGFQQAAGIINFVILTAALSACNATIYSASRMSYHLSTQGYAPRYLKHLSEGGVPVRAIIISAILSSIGILVNYLMPARAFEIITSMSTFICLIIWMVILYTHHRYVLFMKGQERVFALRFHPYSHVLALIILMVVSGIFLAGKNGWVLSIGVAGTLAILIFAYHRWVPQSITVAKAPPAEVVHKIDVRDIRVKNKK